MTSPSWALRTAAREVIPADSPLDGVRLVREAPLTKGRQQ